MSTLPIVPAGAEAGADGRSPPHQHPGRRAGRAAPTAGPHPQDPGQRLIIQEEGGRLIYTVIDRTSGEVVAQAPREEVARMSERPDYEAGRLIRARA